MDSVSVAPANSGQSDVAPTIAEKAERFHREGEHESENPKKRIKLGSKETGAVQSDNERVKGVAQIKAE